MINRDARETELLCRDDTINDARTITAPALLSSAPALGRSFAAHCFISEREAERGAAVCPILCLSPAAVGRVNAFLAWIQPKRRTNLLNRVEKPLARTTPGRIIPRYVRRRVIHSKSFNPFACCFSLDCFFFFSMLLAQVITVGLSLSLFR